MKRFLTGLLLITLCSCVSKKKYVEMQTVLQSQLAECVDNLHDKEGKLVTCEAELEDLKGQVGNLRNSLELREEQLEDCQKLRDRQMTTVGDLTILSQAANENIKETLAQLEERDKYIRLLQAAKTKADSVNLALAVNLKSALNEGLDDTDVEIKVDKTVVFINLSDKMLYQSGSHKLTAEAYRVLEKIAKIVESRPDLEIMVEGYTDNIPINNSCIDDNWDLSVKRATSVVRVLQKNFDVDPNRLIAAGRGEYNALAGNDTQEGRAINRRTRIIILPKINEFYDLLNPDKVPE